MPYPKVYCYKSICRVIKNIAFCASLFFVVSAEAQSLQLWYAKPAVQWTEALPIGNGRLGAMVFGGVGTDRIQFNEETLWTGYPRDYNRKGAYKYLDSIRGLIFAGKQKQAEDLAGREFMGLKSNEGNREAWIKKITSILKLKNNPSQANYNDSSWKTMKVPNYDGWEAAGFEGMDGAVWFRYSFNLPQNWTGKDLIFDVNKITDYDFTYVNGTLIGTQNNPDVRHYLISKNILKPGKNTVAILVLNFTGKGGILGYKDNTKPIGIYPVDKNSDQKLSLNGQWKYFIQDTNVPAVGQYQAAYQPFGDLHFVFDVDEQKVSDYKRSLNLSDAIATTTYTYNNIQFKREYIASAPDQVIALHFTANKKRSISFTAALSSPHKTSSVTKVDASTILLNVKVKDGVLHGSSYLTLHALGGAIKVENTKIVVVEADEVTAWLTANTNYKNYKDISLNPVQLGISTISKLKNKNWQEVKVAHTQEYQKYFNTFSIRFGAAQVAATKNEEAGQPTDLRLENFPHTNDPSFLALYVQYGRYLLISSSRPGTRSANLQGIWNDLLSPPWGSKYTTNINLEMNYWPVDLLNLSPMEDPLFQMIKELSVTGSETAKEYYHAPGWVLHHNTDLWRGTAAINASNHGIWVTGGAWLCDHLWEHYLFTQDKKFLKDTAYPLMKAAAEFFNSILIKDPETGYLISSPSNSPEHGGLVAGPTMDHQIIRNLFNAVIKASEILHVDADFRDTLEKKYHQIAPNKIGSHGQLQEWMHDVDDVNDKHRHVSHLWGVYPGSEINWQTTPDLMKAARQSLIYRGDEATGWSLAWKINLWARFKDGNHTFKLIRMLLRPAGKSAGSYPNLFDAHPPFQIDGNFGAAAGVGEMLVQSQAGFIDLLPALPDALPDGQVDGINARGGFELKMKWQHGKLKLVTVLSKAGATLVLKYKDRTIQMPTIKGSIYTFNGALEKE